ncbi:MAG: sulfite exporter TauE/SafE family protein [Microcoleaceae cyanobacterium]
MFDLLLISLLGFLGSFGHCAGMCGPLTVAFSLSDSTPQHQKHPWQFHLFLNGGRILSYALVGAAIGGVGSVLIASGQVAGIGSEIRRGIAIFTGLMLIGLGLSQLKPAWLPSLPLLHPLSPKTWHERLNRAMMAVSMHQRWWTPVILGLVWGLIPCGFLYTAQIKAAETGDWWQGMLTMFAFGLGTLPTLLGVGIFASKLSSNQRSQLYRLGGWLTLMIGIMTLLRTGSHVDYTGHAALFCLVLALIARPLSRFFPQLLRYRRGLGVGAFICAVLHTVQMIDHTFKWNIAAFEFMINQHQWGTGLGIIALLLMTPAAFTSFDWIQHRLGKYWRSLHLLTVPALLLSSLHILISGSHYLGGFELTPSNQWRVGILIAVTIGVLLVRSRWVWSLLSLDKFYASSSSSSR